LHTSRAGTLCQRRAGTVRHERECACLKNKASYLQKSQFTFRHCRRKCPHNTLGGLGLWAKYGRTRGEKPALLSNLAEISGYISVTVSCKRRAVYLLSTLTVWNPMRLNGIMANPRTNASIG
jgi:hypothetical protein